MQVSILNFISRGLKPVGSLVSNGEPSSDGPRLQIFPASGEAHEATSTTKKRPRKIAADSPRSTKDKPSKRPRKNVRTECAVLVYTPRPGIPSCVEIARLNLIASAKPSCRFFNESLQGVYGSCILPTLTNHAASHTISSRAYSSTTERKSLWKHTIHRPS